MRTIDAEELKHGRKHGRWIYDGDCMITSCCNTAYDINKFQNNNGTILVPTICPNCGVKMGDESNEFK